MGRGQGNAVIPGCALPTQSGMTELLFTTHKMNTDSVRQALTTMPDRDRETEDEVLDLIEN